MNKARQRTFESAIELKHLRKGNVISLEYIGGYVFNRFPAAYDSTVFGGGICIGNMKYTNNEEGC